MTDGLDLEHVRVHEPYDTETVDAALLALAATGNADAAQQVVDIPGRTIRYWRTKYPNRFQAIAEKHAASIEKAVATRVRHSVLNASTVLDQAIALEEQRITEGKVKDAASSARNLATVIGIGVTKILELEGRPTTIVEHRTGEQALKQLTAKGYVVDSEAEELPPDGVSTVDCPS